MKWRGRRASTNVDDARGRRAVGGGAGIGTILNLVLRIFGLKGLLVLGVVGLIGWQMGLLNPAALMGGSQVQEVSYEATAEEEELLQFVKVVLADTEDIWTNELGRVGRQYQIPELVVFRDRYPTACGTGDARMGPFYCPADKKIYIDLGFYADLERQFDAPGDFASRVDVAHGGGGGAISRCRVSALDGRRHGLARRVWLPECAVLVEGLQRRQDLGDVLASSRENVGA